ncbi:MAG: hypothetical protein K6F46_01190 [Desulfovibrio sp.]|nr:hypothetical protein [Desulfovibrio sp.]
MFEVENARELLIRDEGTAGSMADTRVDVINPKNDPKGLSATYRTYRK